CTNLTSTRILTILEAWPRNPMSVVTPICLNRRAAQCRNAYFHFGCIGPRCGGNNVKVTRSMVSLA
ncbi:MAG: hypothetical protein WC383_05695, partial [Gammaproteobacteria bacterium]